MYLLYDFPKFDKIYCREILKHVKKRGTFYIHKDSKQYHDYLLRKCPKFNFEIVATLKNCKVLEKKYKTFTFQDIYSDMEYSTHFEKAKVKDDLKLDTLEPLKLIYGLNSSGKTRTLKELEKNLNANSDKYTLYNLTNGFINKGLDAWYDALCPGMSKIDSELLQSLDKKCKKLSNDISFHKGQLVHTKVSQIDTDLLKSKSLIETSLQEYKRQSIYLENKLGCLRHSDQETSATVGWDIPGLVFTSDFDIENAIQTTHCESLREIYQNTIYYSKTNFDYYNTQLKYITTKIKKLEAQLKTIIITESQFDKTDSENIQEKIKELQTELNIETHFKKKLKSGYYKKRKVEKDVKAIIDFANSTKLVDITYNMASDTAFEIINSTFKSRHFSNFETLLFELCARFYLQQDLILMDETMDIIHSRKQFKELLALFPFKHYIIITHRQDFLE